MQEDAPVSKVHEVHALLLDDAISLFRFNKFVLKELAVAFDPRENRERIHVYIHVILLSAYCFCYLGYKLLCRFNKYIYIFFA